MGIFGIAKKGFGMLGKKVLPTIKSIKPAKNLTRRRKDQQEMFKTIDDQYKEIGVKPGSGASKIKKEGAEKISKIHDKYDKLSKKK